MTDIEQSDGTEGRSQVEALESLDIAQLRKFAKFMNIAAQRDWRAEDYVAAIKMKQEQNALQTFVFDTNTGPAPGYARILLHRDPSPGHANSPVQVGVNGRIIHIPRGIEVDIPHPFVEALNKAITVHTRQVEGDGSLFSRTAYRDEPTISYPFQLIAATPGGKFENQHDNRAANYERRKAFHTALGRWPTDAELKEAMKAKIIRDVK